jgi:hypothetical protein
MESPLIWLILLTCLPTRMFPAIVLSPPITSNLESPLWFLYFSYDVFLPSAFLFLTIFAYRNILKHRVPLNICLDTEYDSQEEYHLRKLLKIKFQMKVI